MRYYAHMVKGVGIDAVEIARMERRCSDMSCAFVVRTFTEAERAEAARRYDVASYFAGRFAVKEATYKAVSHLADGSMLDFRTVETLVDEHGRPFITLSGSLRQALGEVGVSELLVSITNEAGLATAIVIAQ